MKKLVLGAILAIASAGAASAADMAVKARPMPVAVYSWTGCYIGASAGGKFVRARDTAYIPATAGTADSSYSLGTAEPDTWLAGGQVGCNYQTGSWVFGIEGDAHAQRWSNFSTIGGVLPPLFVAGDQFGLSSDWQASVRGRAGYAMDRTLFYVTGGVAFTEVRAYTNYIPVGFFPGTIAYDKKTLTGATVGAGVEYAFTNNLTVGVEGRYTWYGSERFNSGLVAAFGNPGGPFLNSNTYRDVRIETGEILVKANWKFGPSVFAKY